MDVSDWLVPVVVAVLASSFTYLYSIKVTRKSRLYDARLKLYGEFLGRYQAALGSIERILQLQEMDLTKKAVSGNTAFVTRAMLLISELAYAGDSEIPALATDPHELANRVDKKGEVEFLEELRSRAIMLHSQEILRHFSSLRFMAGQLALVTDTGVMSDAMRRVNAVLATGFGKMLGNVAARYPEFFKEFEFGPELATYAKSHEDWLKEVQDVVDALVVNMEMELKRTL